MDVPTMPKTETHTPQSTAFRNLAKILEDLERLGSRCQFSDPQLVLKPSKDGSIAILRGTISVRPGRLNSEMSLEPVAEVTVKPGSLSWSSYDELTIVPAKLARWEYVEPLLDVMRRIFPQAG